MRAINAGVYVPGVQFGDQPCNQPIGYMINNIGGGPAIGGFFVWGCDIFDEFT
jgi:hypothetical protein